MKWADNFIDKIQSLLKWPYYYIVLAVCAAADAFVLFIPIDGLMVTAVYANPKLWIRHALFTVFGSVLGSTVLAFCVQEYGIAFIRKVMPHIEQSKAWSRGHELVDLYGEGAVFFTGLMPIAQQPTTILAALAEMPLPTFALWLFAGRLIKYLIMGGLAAKAPHLVSKLWGLRKEIEKTTHHTPPRE